MTILKFQIFYNGQETYDNHLITYDDEQDKWSITKTTFCTGILGNFWPHKKIRTNQQNLELKTKIYGVEYTFSSSEVAFQAAKCKNPEDIIAFTKKDLHAGDSFRMGRRVQLIDNWDSIKVDVMIDILLCKFTQYQDLQQVLLSTDDAFLIEHTPVKNRDKFWADDCDGTGSNNLGYSLMTVREKIGGRKPNPRCVMMLKQLYEIIQTM